MSDGPPVAIAARIGASFATRGKPQVNVPGAWRMLRRQIYDQEDVMFVIIVLAAMASVYVWHRRRRATTAVPFGSRLAARARLGSFAVLVGWEPSFRFLQLTVVDAIVELRTVSVTGDVWLPSNVTVELAAEDWARIAQLQRPFTDQVASVVAEYAAASGWRLDGPLSLIIVETDDVASCRPVASGQFGTGRDSVPVEHHASASDWMQRRVAPFESTQLMDDVQPVERAAVATSGRPPAALRSQSMTRPVSGLRLDPIDGTSPAIRVGSADDVIVIGRARDVDVRLDVPSVSRTHCRLERDGDSWTLVNLSAHGTTINGQIVGGRAVLGEGDIVELGGVARYRCGHVRPPTRSRTGR